MKGDRFIDQMCCQHKSMAELLEINKPALFSHHYKKSVFLGFTEFLKHFLPNFLNMYSIWQMRSVENLMPTVIISLEWENMEKY